MVLKNLLLVIRMQLLNSFLHVGNLFEHEVLLLNEAEAELLVITSSIQLRHFAKQVGELGGSSHEVERRL